MKKMARQPKVIKLQIRQGKSSKISEIPLSVKISFVLSKGRAKIGFKSFLSILQQMRE
jgi:hypothetical protein